jgi:hypothetical protein
MLCNNRKVVRQAARDKIHGVVSEAGHEFLPRFTAFVERRHRSA